MAIDPDALERQRQAIEALRLAAEHDRVFTERVEAALARRRAELEAVRLGLRRECSAGCGREIGKANRTGVCTRCQNVRWMRHQRAALRLVGGGGRP
jgi:hypothetical protein